MKFLRIFLFSAFLLLVKSQHQKCNTRSGKSGTCIDLNACTSLMTFLNATRNYLQWFLITREYGCSLTGNKLKMCCPNFKTNGDSEEPPDVGNHPNLKLLPYECGVSQTQDKIIHGNKTHIYEFPWMARLLYNTSKSPEFKCGATVLNNNYLLTAAHCIKTNQLIGARVGDHDFSKDKDCELDEEKAEICLPPPQNLAIEEMIPHPEYNRKTKKNDIGLLRVSRMNFSGNAVNAVCMPLAKTRNYNFTKKFGIISGWGNTEKREPSPVLLKVSLPIISLPACKLVYGDDAIDQRQFCISSKKPTCRRCPEQDVCFGDSGGPLQLANILNEDTRTVQHGIISHALFDTCGKGHPVVLTKIAYYMNWILDTIKP